jgi:hypothetical protein
LIVNRFTTHIDFQLKLDFEYFIQVIHSSRTIFFKSGVELDDEGVLWYFLSNIRFTAGRASLESFDFAFFPK